MGKKQTEAVTNAVTSFMKAAEQSIKETSSQMKSPAIKSLEDLKNTYETVDVRIRKRDAKTGRFAHLIQMDRQSPTNLEEIGFEEICKDQAGGGEYQVLIKPPDVRSWTGAIKYDGIHVSGIGYDTAKGDRMGINSIGGPLPQTNAQYTPPQWNFQKGQQNEMKDVMKQQMEQSMGMNDRMLMLMQNASQQQMQMMQAFMASMVGNQNRGSDENSEVRVLKERIERMEQERRSEERYAALAKEQSELRQQLLLAQHAPKNGADDFNKLMLTLLSTQQSSQQAANTQYVDLVKELLQRPSEDEKISNITGTMIRSFQGQMDLMNSALRNGLLSSGGPEHPVAQIVSQALEGLTQVATVAFENKGAHQEEPEYTDGPAMVTPMPSYQEQMPEVASLDGIPTAPQLNSHPESIAPDPEPEPEPEATAPEPKIEDILLTEEELGRIARDTALNQILAKIQNGIPICEATARIYAHARANNNISIRWLQYPDIISNQVLTYYNLERRIKELQEDIVKFLHYLSNEGDPNQWSRETGYRPIKSAVPNSTSMVPPPQTPEFGVSRGTPEVGEIYDSEFPQSITPPPPVNEPVESQPETVDEMTVEEPTEEPKTDLHIVKNEEMPPEETQPQ